MSGDLTLALRTMQSGLLTNQLALNTVAGNIANAHTPGYSRKIVQLEQRVLAGSGAGVQLAQITRRVDEGLMTSLRGELTSLKAIDVKSEFLARIQDLFGSPESNASLAHTLGGFAEALEGLALSPENMLDQNEVVRVGEATAQQFREMSATIQELRQQADADIAAAVNEINGLLADIVDANERIVAGNTIGNSTADLADQRDRALDRLAELIDIRVFKRDDGDIVVFTSAGRVLVDNAATTLSHSPATSVRADSTHAEGNFTGIHVGGAVATNDITDSIRGGRLAGLIELRDALLPDLQTDLDTLAAGLRDTINRIHNRGVGYPGLQTMTGTRVFTDPATQTITLGAGDVKLIVLDGDGRQLDVGSLPVLLGAGASSIEDVQAAIDGFLGANGSADMVAGQFVITMASGRHLAIRDEDAGGAAADIAITFDADSTAAGNTLTAAGFASFFGLNDFFVDGRRGNVHQSRIVDPAFRAGSDATLTVLGTGSPPGKSVAIAAASTLADIAAAVNFADVGVAATVVPDGAGARLRFASADGTAISIVDAAGNTLLADLGVHESDTGVAASLEVRSDIVARPSLVARGTAHWDAGRGAAGEYYTSAGDNTAVAALAAALAAPATLPAAGSIGTSALTFTQYAATLLGDTATRTRRFEDAALQQQAFVDNLQAKSDAIRGVNLDEEMTDLMLYEQAYAASARLIAVVQSMFDALEQAVG